MNSTATTSRTQPTSAPSAEQSRLEVRRHETWSPGDAAHQGDLILVCIPHLPPSAKPRADRQMAEGETRGSKHIVAGGAVFDADPAEVAGMISKATGGRVSPDVQYIGPVFQGPCTLEHPEHQHQAFPAETVTAVVFQRNQDAEERDQRAQD